jgi:hypothetical protein
MNYTTAQKIEPKTTLPGLITPTSKKRGLAASWFKVEGRLVCKWFPVENQ